MSLEGGREREREREVERGGGERKRERDGEGGRERRRYILISPLSIPILVNTDLQTVSFTDIHFLYAGYVSKHTTHVLYQ